MTRAIGTGCRWLVLLVTLAAMIGPVATPGAAAQGEECPEGLVYWQEEDICVLPENLPPDANGGTGAPLEDEAPPDEPVDEEPVDEEPVEEEPADDIDDGDDLDGGDDEAAPEDGEEPAELVDDEAEGEEGADDAAPIANIIVLTHQCPPNWNPATRELADSAEVCTTTQDPAVTYTLLREGETITQVGAPGIIDLDRDLPGLLPRAGFWTITESPSDKLLDPFVTCSILDPAGQSRPFINEVVPSGQVEVRLTEGETLVCEWYSTSVVPEVVGDPNALPMADLGMAFYSCPEGFDPLANFGQAKTTCLWPSSPGFTYTITLEDAVITTFTAKADGVVLDIDDFIGSRLLADHRYTVTVTPVGAYDTPKMLCERQREDGSDASHSVSVTGVGMGLGLTGEPGMSLTCHYFNMEQGARPESSLGFSVAIQACPPGTDLSALSDEQKKATCTAPLPFDIDFAFDRDGKRVFSTTVTPAAPSITVTENGGTPLAGRWVIWSSFPPGTGDVQAQCFGTQPNSAVVNSSFLTALNGKTELEIVGGFLETCTFFMVIPSSEAALQAVSWQCPDGSTPATMAPNERASTCTPWVERDVVLESGQGNGQAVRTNFQGLAAIPAVAGLNTVRQPAMDGWATPFVTCTQTIAATGQFFTLEPTLNSDGQSVTLEIDEGDSLRCDFFNVRGVAEEAPGPEIWPTAWLCPADVDPAATDLATLAGTCQEVTTGIRFTISTNGTDVDSETPGDDGRIGFTDLPVDDPAVPQRFRIAQSGPFGSPKVGCMVDAEDQPYVPAEVPLVDDGAVEQQLAPGQVLTCDWFVREGPAAGEQMDGEEENEDGQLPGDDGEGDMGDPAGAVDGNEQLAGVAQLTIQAWACPPTVVPGASYEEHVLACAPGAEAGLPELEQAGVAIPPDITGGLLTWSDLPPGPVQIPAIAPEGWVEPALWCSARTMVNGEEVATFAEPVPLEDGAFTLEIAPESTVFCDWFGHPAVALAPAPVAAWW